MSDVQLDLQSPPASPAVGSAIPYFDSITGLLSQKTADGFVRSIGQTNFSVAAQVVPAAVRTYIAGSQVIVPGCKLQVGTCFRWRFNVTKTAAGTALSTYDIAVGLTGLVADVARVSFIKPAGTAVADEGIIEILATVRGPLSASGVMVGEFRLAHNLAATGHAVIPNVVVNTISAPFDVTPPGLVVGLCLTSGLADAITIQMVQAEAWNL